MNNPPSSPDGFDQWVAHRRNVQPPEDLSELVMQQINDTRAVYQQTLSFRILQQIERSRLARCCACSGALAVGCFPFLFLAYVAKFL
jgi:hypothetical protein